MMKRWFLFKFLLILVLYGGPCYGKSSFTPLPKKEKFETENHKKGSFKNKSDQSQSESLKSEKSRLSYIAKMSASSLEVDDESEILAISKNRSRQKASRNSENSSASSFVSENLDNDLLSEEGKAEKDIPLDLDSSGDNQSKATQSQYGRIFGAVGAILFFGLILLGWILRKGVNGSLRSEMKNIKILAKKNLGGKKDLMIVRVAGESILLGVTDHNINLIKPLSLMDDELPPGEVQSFSEQIEEHMEPIEEVDFPEEIDNYAVSSLDSVREVVTQRFSQ